MLRYQGDEPHVEFMTVEIHVETLIVSQQVLCGIHGFNGKNLRIDQHVFWQCQIEFRQGFLSVRRQQSAAGLAKSCCRCGAFFVQGDCFPFLVKQPGQSCACRTKADDGNVVDVGRAAYVLYAGYVVHVLYVLHVVRGDSCQMYFRCLSPGQTINHDGKKVRDAADEDKDMKNPVHVSVLSAEAVKHRAQCVEEAADDYEYEARYGEEADKGFDDKENRPAHTEVGDHGEDGEFLQVYGVEGDADGGTAPDQEHHAQGQPGMSRAQDAEQQWCVCAGDEEKDGTVVNDLEDFFGDDGFQTVIETGHGVENDQGGGVNSAGDDAPGGAVDDGDDQAGHEGGNGQGAADDMGDGVKDFLAFGVVRKLAVYQGCAWHKDLLILIPVFRGKGFPEVCRITNRIQFFNIKNQ